MKTLLASTLLLAIFASGMGFREWLLSSILYHPDNDFFLTAKELGIDAEQLRIATEDGIRIQAYWLPFQQTDRTLLFLHGNAGNASHRLYNADMLRKMGTNVLLLEYRGYGRSEGSVSESGLYADARAGMQYLLTERSISENRIIVFGRSLGGAVAVDVAQDRDLAGVILESSFSSLSDAAASLVGLPIGWLASGLYDSISKIGRVRAPLLFFHGDRDEVIRYRVGQRLFEAAPEPKQFVTLEGAHHNDTVSVGGADYARRIDRFIHEVAP